MAAFCGGGEAYFWSSPMARSTSSKSSEGSSAESDSRVTSASSPEASLPSPFRVDHKTGRAHDNETGTLDIVGPTARSVPDVVAALRAALELGRQRQQHFATAQSCVRLKVKSAVWPDDAGRRELEREYGRLRLQWDGEVENLIIKAMPTAFHEASHRALADVIVEELANYGVREHVACYGATSQSTLSKSSPLPSGSQSVN